MRIRFRAAPPIALIFLISVSIAGCGGGSASGSGTGSSSSTTKYAGINAVPSKPAPPLVLNDSLGHRVDLSQYRGKAVLVTFIYDHCPDICPLIVGNLHTAQAELGSKASDLQIIAVSVDPTGDTPRTVKAFLAAHQMTGRMEYLIGSRPQLEKTWSDWKIVAKSSPSRGSPDAVEHSALIYGIDGSGRMTTLYPSNFKPQQIVHDVPILASQ
ncbi:MAG TPA: SCO family protein [Solirubrobacterales bacterium]|nr:SCO family protein [Solirubrobacterales bacterium]